MRWVQGLRDQWEQRWLLVGPGSPGTSPRLEDAAAPGAPSPFSVKGVVLQSHGLTFCDSSSG